MKTLKTERTRVPRRRPLSAVVALPLLAALLTLVGTGAASATGKGSGVFGTVTYADDGSPAAGAQVDLYEASSPWDRGDYVGSAASDGNGNYSFDVGAGCYVSVVIAPLGTEFDFVGSGDLYDQLYGCASAAGPAEFRSVLYRDVKPPPPPPTTQPPTTQPPTTQPPTTQPPTTQPPTTQPPPQECIHVDDAEWTYRPGDQEVQYEIKIDDSDLGYDDPDFVWIDTDAIEAAVPGSRWARPETEFDNNDVQAENEAPLPQGVSIRDLPREVLTTVETRAHGEEQILICMTVRQVSPIGLDVDGSGAVERISGEFRFDFDADGESELVSEWFASTEGVLIDSRVAGELSGAHLFGDQGGRFATGFEKLALLDANADGRVAGAELDGLAIWIDANSNAAVDAGEISSLVDHGVVALSTSHVDMVSEATLADGSTMMTEDLWFSVAAQGAAGNSFVQLGLGSAAFVGLVAAAFGAASRRREDFDAELAELLDREQTIQ